MLRIEESNRNNPSTFICAECGSPVNMVIHHDFIDGICCGITYAIRVNEKVWNCCSKPDNGCGYECKKGEDWVAQAKLYNGANKLL